MKPILAAVFHLLFINLLFSQPTVEWKSTYGGSDSEEMRSLQPTSDNGYIFIGNTQSDDGNIDQFFGVIDIWVVKLAEDGSIEWENTYGGSGQDEGHDIQQTTDGGYIFVGGSASNDGQVGGNNGSVDVWVVKIGQQGNIEWSYNYGGSEADYPNSVIQTTDGGFLIAAGTQSDIGDMGDSYLKASFWVIKLDPSGLLEWDYVYGGDLYEVPQIAVQTMDGGYLVGGGSSSQDGDVQANYGEYDTWLLKLNSDGIIEWENNYGGSAWDYLSSVTETSDGGFLCAGFSRSTDYDLAANYGLDDAWVFKVNKDGIFEWGQNYGGTERDFAISLQESEEGGYLMAGGTKSSDFDVDQNYGDFDFWLVKLFSDGTIDWEQNFGGSDWDATRTLAITSNGGIILGGVSKSDDIDVATNYGESDVWLLKFAPISTYLQNPENNSAKIEVSPNPSQGKFNIEFINSLEKRANLRVIDSRGHTVFITKLPPGSKSTTIDLQGMNAGTYILILSLDKTTTIKKLVVIN